MYIYLLFLLAFFLRLINLNQSLWLDEAVVAKVVKTIPLFQIPFQFSPGDFHPPLYYLIMSLWTHLFGFSELSLRMPSIIFSLIAGWYVFRIGTFLKDKKRGLWAAAFFLFNPLIVYYSQEARMYMMATAFLTMALYHFLLLIHEYQNKKTKGRIKNILFFNLFSVLAMFTFYGSAFFISGMIMVGCFLIFMKMKRQKENFSNWIPTFMGLVWGLLISLLVLSPLLLQQLHTAQISLQEVKNWSLVLGKAELKNVLMIFIKFATGRLSWYPKWSYYIIAGIPTAVTWLLVGFGMKKNKLLGYVFFLPLLFGLLVSFLTPMMMYFRFLYLIPVMSLLLANGVFDKGKSLDWIPAFAGMTAIFIIFSLAYLLLPQFHREDWRSLSQNLDRNIPVYMIVPSSDPIFYYRSDISVSELRDIKKVSIPKSIYVIPYTSEIYGLNYTQLLKEKECIKESQMHFRGDLLLEKWKCPASFIGHLGIGAI